ncbi:MAG: hypothetical protein N2169_07100 [bacterium]|nr:hypothetical protein [bacterium]
MPKLSKSKKISGNKISTAGQFIEKFFYDLNDKITRTRENKISSPLEIISNKFNLDVHASHLIGLVPEILFGFLEGKKKDARSIISFYCPKEVKNLKERKGVLLCHALSPFSESIGLLADIGRGFRISLGLGLPMKVMLAGTSWTEYNWVVVDLDLSQNLPYNQLWRQQFYAYLGIDYDLLTTDNIIETDIRLMASNYVELSKAIWGKSINTRKLSYDQVKKCLDSLKLYPKNNVGIDLFSINVLSPALKPHKIALECILKNFLRVDFVTFLYFFLQYYHQLRYKGYLKVSVARERDFDESFRLIDSKMTKDERDERDLAGLYFPDYEYGKIEINNKSEKLTALPYYFPSGTIYKLFRNNLEGAINHCIILNDGCNQTDKTEKIKTILKSCDKFSKARLISDLLSFAHLFALKNSNVRNKVKNWMQSIRSKDFSKTLLNSWDIYASDNSNKTFSHDCKEWSYLAFTVFAKDIPIPYFFLPYLWENEVSVEEEANLIKILLQLSVDTFGVPQLSIKKLSRKIKATKLP